MAQSSNKITVKVSSPGPRGPAGPQASPAGENGAIQYNNNGVFSAAEGINYRSGSSTIEITGSLTVSGSNTFKVIGPAILSTLQITGTSGLQQGLDTTVVQDYGTAQGFQSDAKAGYSHAEGYNTRTFGEGAHSEGESTLAYGNYSHAEGAGTRTIGESSHAEGIRTVAKGIGSHAEGRDTEAYGDYSHAEGNSTQAYGQYQTVVGQYNKLNNTTDLFVVGGGTSTERRDTFAVRSGSVIVSGSVSVSGSLFIDGAPYDDGIYRSTLVATPCTTYNWSVLLFGGVNQARGVTYAYYAKQACSSSYPWDWTTQGGIIASSTRSGLTATALGALAHGTDSEASGESSHAEGYNTAATGSYTHAEGENTTARGRSSHAEGIDTDANGDYSHAEGQDTTANGNASHAEGIYSIASASFAHAEGYSTKAYGESSHAEGIRTFARGKQSHAEGYETNAGVLAYTTATNGVGGAVSNQIVLNSTYGNVVGQFVVGEQIVLFDPVFTNNFLFTLTVTNVTYSNPNTIITVSTNVNGLVYNNFGYIGIINNTGPTNANVIIGDNTHSEGYSTLALAPNSHAEGYQSKTTGLAAHSEGKNSVAEGDYSHAEGYGSQATGDYAHAEGDGTIAFGYASHAEGLQTIASGSNQHVTGQYNLHNNTSDLFVIGDGGDDSTRSNAFGVNNERMYASNSIYFPDLTTTQSNYVLVFNTESKQVFYTASSGLGGGSNPASPVTSIQFNSASAFGGSSNFTWTNTNSLLTITGSQKIYKSGSGVLSIEGSGSAAPLLSVYGSQGQLFSVTDNISGSLLSVRDISGLAVLEANSNSTVTLGSYLAPALFTTVTKTANTGSTFVYSLNTSSYSGVFVDYTATSGSVARAGSITAIWIPSTGLISNTQSPNSASIGTSTGFGLIMSASLTAGSASLFTSASSNSWSVKVLIKSI